MPRWLAVAAVLAWWACAAGAQVQTFRFAHVTDTHVSGPKGHADAVRTFLKAAAGLSPRVAFVVNTGDATELGTPAEFDAYTAALAGAAMPVYTAPGNHDVRWAPLGKEAFERAVGYLYRSFDYGGCHFVVLDSTVLLEHWGHFDGAQLAWLKKDLAGVKKGTPVFVFFHHPILWPRRMVDNDQELLRVLEPHNVVAAFVGHGHSDTAWTANGLQFVEARGLYQDSYHLADVDAEKAVISLVKSTLPQPRVVATIPLRSRPGYRVDFKWGRPTAGARPFTVRLAPRGPSASTGTAQGTWELNAQPEVALEPQGDALAGVLQTAGLGNGTHVVTLRLKAPDGTSYVHEAAFPHEEAPDRPRRAWAFRTADTIQSSPVLAGQALYVTSFDGRVYALDAGTGKRRWAARTGGRIFASPLVTEDSVYVGSMDHRFYAFDARTGRERWRYDSGAPIFATAAIADGVVCFGGNKRIHALRAATGEVAWTQPAGGFFQSRAAATDGVFVLGGWDNALYALDTRTGAPRWKTTMGRSNGGTGTVMFYFSPAITSPAVGPGRVYVCTNDGVLHAVNVKTGQDDWTARAPSGGDTFGYSSPLYHEGRVYLGGLGEVRRGNCYALDADTGALVWNCRTGADNYDSGPALSGGMVVIGSVEGTLTWIDPATGQVRWRYQLDPGFTFSTPAGDTRTAWMTSMNGQVYGIALPAP